MHPFAGFPPLSDCLSLQRWGWRWRGCSCRSSLREAILALVQRRGFQTITPGRWYYLSNAEQVARCLRSTLSLGGAYRSRPAFANCDYGAGILLHALVLREAGRRKVSKSAPSGTTPTDSTSDKQIQMHKQTLRAIAIISSVYMGAISACGSPPDASNKEIIQAASQAQTNGGGTLDERLQCVMWCLDQCPGGDVLGNPKRMECTLVCVDVFCDGNSGALSSSGANHTPVLSNEVIGPPARPVSVQIAPATPQVLAP